MNIIPFPQEQGVPQHIAIVMDGNRRWAHQRGLPKAVGHARGAQRIQSAVLACRELGVRYLTLFAFSTENWRRPQEEVFSLMGLFVHYLEKEVDSMLKGGVRLVVAGDTARFDARLQDLMHLAQEKTAHNRRLTLTIAANYGGRWDMLQAARSWQAANPGVSLDELSETGLQPHLSLSHAPDPELVIRTGGESRMSNFLLWQSAYAELYFTPILWPDFTEQVLQEALFWYAQRERRFGVSAQRTAS
jgi:undecaprenyl diphosphate synthase